MPPKTHSRVEKKRVLSLTSACAGPGAIAYEQFGTIYLYDLNSHASKRLEVTVAGDLPEVRPRFLKIEPRRIRNAALSPTGARGLRGARGEFVRAGGKRGRVRAV